MVMFASWSPEEVSEWLVRAVILQSLQFTIYDLLAAIYTVYTSPNHPLVPNHPSTLIVTPHDALEFHFCDHGPRSHTSGTSRAAHKYPQFVSSHEFSVVWPVCKTILKGQSNHRAIERGELLAYPALSVRLDPQLGKEEAPLVSRVRSVLIGGGLIATDYSVELGQTGRVHFDRAAINSARISIRAEDLSS